MALDTFNVQKFISGTATDPDIVSQFPRWFAEWQALLGIAFATSVALLTVMYIIGILLRNNAVINFVKFEMYELIVTALIVVSLVALIDFMQNRFDVSFVFPHSQFYIPHAPGRQIYAYEATQAYYETVQNKLQGWMGATYALGAWLDNFASATPYARPLGVGIIAAPWAGFASPLRQIAYNVMTALGIGYIITTAQLVIFKFSVVGFLRYYLPIGVFLRAFTPTRRIGGALIAIALGFLFILPLMTIFSGEMVLGPGSLVDGIDGAITRTLNSPDPTPGGTGQPLIGPTAANPGSIGTALNPAKSANSFSDFAWDATFGLFNSIGSIIQKGIGWGLFIAFLLPLHIVGIAFAIAYLLPALMVVVLVQAIKQMSRSLGEEVDVTTLTKLI